MILARDDYRRYFAEKLWEWMPEIYRELDHLEGGDALRGFIEALADQAALLKRSQDRLWDDAFVELASDWAIPYLGSLVGTRLVSALNPRARRVDVAKTIYYRRRKGTLAVLEQLIADMTQWDGKVVESFRRLGRMHHALDGPVRYGRITQTAGGGWANLHSPRAAGLVGDPFDEFHHLPDMRKPKGRLGLYGVTKLNFHVYSLQSVEYVGVKPRHMKVLPGTHHGFTFDPSGREIPLFAANVPEKNWAQWHTAEPWLLPRAISCCLLAEARYQPGSDLIAWVLDPGLNGAPIASVAQREAAVKDLQRLAGGVFNAAQLRHVLRGMPSAATLTDPGVWVGLLSHALQPDCGSAALLPDATGESSIGIPALGLSFQGVSAPPLVPRTRTCAANLEDWAVPIPSGMDLVVDPERGRLLVNPGVHTHASIRVRYHVGMLAPLGAGAYDRQVPDAAVDSHWQNGGFGTGVPMTGLAEIQDSGTYVDPTDAADLRSTVVRAAEGQRPYLRLNNFWRLTAGIPDASLALDGLWIGTRTTPRSVVLQAKDPSCTFARVSLKYCTLDPGGEDANGANLPPVALVITCFVEELVVEHCILSSIRLDGAKARVQRLIIRDSLVHARTAGLIPIDLPACHIQMERCTLVAAELPDLALEAERLEASDSLVAGRMVITDTQSGCFRFSARGPGSSAPHPYRSLVLVDLPRLFASRRFGDPDYLRLSEVAPAEVLRGSEQGSHMGVFCAAMLPSKLDSLATKIDEFMPFGRLPHVIFEN